VIAPVRRCLRRGATAWLAMLGLAPMARAWLSADAVFRPPVLGSVVLSPSGELLAAVGVDQRQDAVIVRRREGGERTVALRTPHEIGGIAWVDDRNLLVYVEERGDPELYVVSITSGGEGLVTEQTWVSS
jgi:hypothetical protein